MRIQILILWFKGLKKRGEPCKCQKKVGLARRVTRLAAGSPFCEGIGSPSYLSQLFSIQTLWLAQLGQLGQRETIKVCASAVDSDKGVNCFFGLPSWRVTVFFGTTFLHYPASRVLFPTYLGRSKETVFAGYFFILTGPKGMR